jgi:hypothetical protein
MPSVFVYVVPLMLYVMPPPGAGAVIWIVPVARAQVGCVTFKTGATGFGVSVTVALPLIVVVP